MSGESTHAAITAALDTLAGPAGAVGPSRPVLYVAGDTTADEGPGTAELYRRWLSGQGLSGNTIGQRVRFLERIHREWGTLDRPPFEVAEWLGQFTGWTRKSYLAHLRSVYAFLIETGQAESSPIARYRTPPSPAPNARPLTPEKSAELLEAATGNLYAFLVLGMFAGLRCHEIAKVRGEDVDQGTLRVLGKGGREAVLPTHPVLWEVALRYPRQGYWFPSPLEARDHLDTGYVGRQIREHLRAHDIPDGSAHRLRYSFGTTLARAGVQVRVVQELLRHQSLVTTQRYLAVDDAEKAEAVRRLSGWPRPDGGAR